MTKNLNAIRIWFEFFIELALYCFTSKLIMKHFICHVGILSNINLFKDTQATKSILLGMHFLLQYQNVRRFWSPDFNPFPSMNVDDVPKSYQVLGLETYRSFNPLHNMNLKSWTKGWLEIQFLRLWMLYTTMRFQLTPM